MSKTTAKVVADVEPTLKRAFDRAAVRQKMTKRAALEEAMRLWLRQPSTQGVGKA